MTEEDKASLLRIIDANLNRAAEALRTVEDVCRFHWSLKGFAGDLKALRHSLFAAFSTGGMGREEIIRHRDIEGDVGRESVSPGSAQDPAGMAFRNLERAKEALRALEEASRLVQPDLARVLEQSRYRLYAIEKGLSRLSSRRGGEAAQGPPARLAGVRLCLLATSGFTRRPLEDVVREAIRAGAGMVQLREKDASDRELLETARSLREVTAREGAIFVVNDRPDIAVLAGADGVHLGQDDLPPSEARRIVGQHLLVGVSTHSLEQARSAEQQGADYLGAGPMFPTATKDAGPILGPDGLRCLLPEISVPAFAIGGISVETVDQVAAAGGRRIAVSSAVLRADDPAGVVRRLLERL